MNDIYTGLIPLKLKLIKENYVKARLTTKDKNIRTTTENRFVNLFVKSRFLLHLLND